MTKTNICLSEAEEKLRKAEDECTLLRNFSTLRSYKGERQEIFGEIFLQMILKFKVHLYHDKILFRDHYKDPD